MNNNLKGFAYGIATSVTFGLIPLFTLPLMEKGMRFDSILFYRFLFAAIALSGMLLAKKESFRTEMRNLSDIRNPIHAVCIQRKNIMDYALGDRARYLWSSPSIH